MPDLREIHSRLETVLSSLTDLTDPKAQYTIQQLELMRRALDDLDNATAHLVDRFADETEQQRLERVAHYANGMEGWGDPVKDFP